MNLPPPLKDDLSVEPNGSFLELQTAPVPAEIYSAVRAHSGETHEVFGRRILTRKDVSWSYGNDGIGPNSPDMCAAFRLNILEGILFDPDSQGIPPEGVRKLADCAGGAEDLASELGVRECTLNVWMECGAPATRSRWSHILRALFGDEFWRVE